jgi:hypothetical protein
MTIDRFSVGARVRGGARSVRGAHLASECAGARGAYIYAPAPRTLAAHRAHGAVGEQKGRTGREACQPALKQALADEPNPARACARVFPSSAPSLVQRSSGRAPASRANARHSPSSSAQLHLALHTERHIAPTSERNPRRRTP